jgi:hypothetical protein
MVSPAGSERNKVAELDAPVFTSQLAPGVRHSSTSFPTEYRDLRLPIRRRYSTGRKER